MAATDPMVTADRFLFVLSFRCTIRARLIFLTPLDVFRHSLLRFVDHFYFHSFSNIVLAGYIKAQDMRYAVLVGLLGIAGCAAAVSPRVKPGEEGEDSWQRRQEVREGPVGVQLARVIKGDSGKPRTPLQS